MTIQSPRGEAIWPSLTEPNQFQNTGPFTYSCKLRMNLKAPGVADFLQEMESVLEASKEDLQQRRAKRGEKPLTPAMLAKQAPCPFHLEVDDDNVPTGNMILKTKLKAERSFGDKVTQQRPLVFDEYGRDWNLETPIYGGSTVAVSFDAVPYYTPALGYGLTLQLRAAQVLELVTTGGQKTAKSFGFETKELPPELTQAETPDEFASEAFDDL